MNKKGLTVNIMVRNEYWTIWEAIMSSVPHADAAVIVDTGSNDGTKKLIEDAISRFPDKPIIYKEMDLPSQSPWSLMHGRSPHPSRDLGDVRNWMRDYSPTEWIWTVDADEVYTDRAGAQVAGLVHGNAIPAHVECAYLPIRWMSLNPANEATRAAPGIYLWTGRLFRNNLNYVHANFDLSAKYDVCFPGEAAHYYEPDGRWRVPIPGQTRNCIRYEPREITPIFHYEMTTKPWRRRALHDRVVADRPEVFVRRKAVFGENIYDAFKAKKIACNPS